jgi:hypothetical protein
LVLRVLNGNLKNTNKGSYCSQLCNKKHKNNSIKLNCDYCGKSIEKLPSEIKNYKNHFKDKIIYCNCDDPRESNFFKYFYVNFEKLGLKKLIASFYKDQSDSLITAKTVEKPFWVEYTGKKKVIKSTI